MLIGPEIHEAAAQVLAYARSHPIDARRILHLLSHPEDAPGHTPGHVLEIPVGFRVVFTIEQQPDHGWCRHLSMSVPVKGRYPQQVAVEMVMSLFLFNLPFHKCMVWTMQEQLDSVNVLEPYPEFKP